MLRTEVGERGLLRGTTPLVRTRAANRTDSLLNTASRAHALARLTAQLAVVALLLCLAVANLYVRSTWSEPEDGVRWATTPDGVVAQEIAIGSPAARAGIRAGDILAEIDFAPIDSESDVVARLHRASSGDSVTYTLIRTKTK